MSPGPSSAPSRPRRPFPVVVLAAIQLLNAFFFTIVSVAILLDPGAVTGVIDVLESLGLRSGALRDVEGPLVGLAVGAVALIYALVAVALLRLRRSGWTFTMLLAGVALVTQIYSWINGGELVALAMLLNVITVIYLNQRQVRVVFGISGSRIGDSLDSLSR